MKMEYADEDLKRIDSDIKRYYSKYNEGLGATRRRNDSILAYQLYAGKNNNVLQKWKDEYLKLLNGHPERKIVIREVYGGCDISFEDVPFENECIEIPF